MIGLQLGYVYGEDDGAENPRVFEPSARPGARLPHAWLAEVRGRSTLDLVNLSRPTLISFGDHETWTTAAGAWEFLDHIRVGVDTAELDGWRDVCEVEPTGGVLVRPDQHVAWRGVTGEATEGLAAAMAAVSGDS